MTARAPRSICALTLVEVVVVLAVLALLAVILIPALQKAKWRSARIGCTSRLKQHGLAFRIFANDHEDRFPMRVSTNKGGTLEYTLDVAQMWRHLQVLSNLLSTPRVLACPADTRRPAISFDSLANTNISYFLGLDADETHPGVWLSGDRNLQLDGVPLSTGVWELRTNRNLSWGPGLHTEPGRAFGIVALSDGSVQQTSDALLQGPLRDSGDGTNRVAIP